MVRTCSEHISETFESLSCDRKNAIAETELFLDLETGGKKAAITEGDLTLTGSERNATIKLPDV